jgi:hypothetical protein
VVGGSEVAALVLEQVTGRDGLSDVQRVYLT